MDTTTTQEISPNDVLCKLPKGFYNNLRIFADSCTPKTSPEVGNELRCIICSYLTSHNIK